MNQTDQASQQSAHDDIDLRQQQRAEAMRAIMPEGGRVVPRADYPQPVFRGDRTPAPSQRVREYTVDDFDMREDGARPMAAHPLFRGLLQELPDRGAAPSQEWLDRWTSTARSILDLLYSRDPLA